MSEFALEWQERYLRGTATYKHLERLKAINKLTEEEFKQIIVSKRLRDKGVI